ncbi:MAG: hypothetical protein EHM32_13285 [Spirochaetales bacterium]|nr:MAG: hypothetical protein EHM32_13285 [Spirochaetales bacterium]
MLRLPDDLQYAKDDFAARRETALYDFLPANGRVCWGKGEIEGLQSILESCRTVESIRGAIVELRDDDAHRAETLGIPLILPPPPYCMRVLDLVT